VAALHGRGVADEALRRIAAAAGVAVAHEGAAPRPGDVLVFAGMGRADLAAALSEGFAVCVEAIDDEVPPPRLRADGDGSLALSIGTATAWSLDTAAVFCDGLEAREMLSAERRPDVELALHEAVANAIIHGNLALGSSFGADAAAFDAFCRLLSDRMAEPGMAGRRVDLRAAPEAGGGLSLRVADEGQGFDPAALAGHAPDPEARSGRGLEIIRAMTVRVAIEDGGRTTVMSFDP